MKKFGTWVKIEKTKFLFFVVFFLFFFFLFFSLLLSLLFITRSITKNPLSDRISSPLVWWVEHFLFFILLFRFHNFKKRLQDLLSLFWFTLQFSLSLFLRNQVVQDGFGHGWFERFCWCCHCCCCCWGLVENKICNKTLKRNCAAISWEFPPIFSFSDKFGIHKRGSFGPKFYLLSLFVHDGL